VLVYIDHISAILLHQTAAVFKVYIQLTFCYIAGVLPGSKFGFNSHGLMFGNNNIYQKGVNLDGIRTCVYVILVISVTIYFKLL